RLHVPVHALRTRSAGGSGPRAARTLGRGECRGMHFLLAEFATARAAIDAARRAQDQGHAAPDLLTPHPMEEDVADALEPPPAKAPVGWVMFIAATVGAVIGYAMQWFSAVIDYPIDSGGRPLNSWPVFLPVPYEIAILLAGICGILGWLFFCGLPK